MKSVVHKTLIVVLAVAGGLSAGQLKASAQESGGDSAGAAEPDMRQVFKGFFTPQPQYPTPGVTLMNPDAIPAKTEEPMKQLFAPQPQYPTPGTTIMNGQPESSKGDNPMAGFFQTQPQYPSPGKTLMNPEWAPSGFEKSGDPTTHIHVIDGGAYSKELPSEYRHDNPASKMTSGPPNGDVSRPEAFPHVYGAGEHPQIGEHTFSPETHPRPTPHRLDADASPANGLGDRFWQNLPPLPKRQAAATVPAAAKVVAPAKPKPKDDKKKGKDSKKGKGKDAKETDSKKDSPDSATGGKDAADASSDNSLHKAPPVVGDNPLKQAIGLMNSRAYDKSLQSIDQVLSKTPDSPNAHYLKAVVLVMSRRYQDAAAEYRKVQTLSPNSPISQRAEDGLKKIGL